MVRAIEMALSNKYAHERPDGSCFGGKYASTVYKVLASNPGGSYSIGENITYASSPSGAMSSWRNSPSHYKAMVNANYKSIGIGKFTYAGRTYWVQIFLTR